MTQKEMFRPFIDACIENANELGLDLYTDYMELTLTYPDMPGVEVYFRVGGMFANATITNEEELH